jgi:hypothetical protein
MTVRRSALRLIALALLATATSGAGFFHNHLTKSTPAAKATLTAAPTQIRLWFAEKPEIALTRITLRTADSTRITLGKVATTDDTLSVTAPVTGAMAKGGYVVSWQTAGKDGHVIRGSFPFTVK